MTFGASIKTAGVSVVPYPEPPSVIVIESTTPEEIVAVALALVVVPSPTGDCITTRGAEVYPKPPSEMVIADIVPAEETVAVANAGTIES